MDNDELNLICTMAATIYASRFKCTRPAVPYGYGQAEYSLLTIEESLSEARAILAAAKASTPASKHPLPSHLMWVEHYSAGKVWSLEDRSGKIYGSVLPGHIRSWASVGDKISATGLGLFDTVVQAKAAVEAAARTAEEYKRQQKKEERERRDAALALCADVPTDVLSAMGAGWLKRYLEKGTIKEGGS